MRIDKFLEKVHQDERVDSVSYEKGWGYRISTKDGYGILENVEVNNYIDNHTCVNCRKVKVTNYIRSNTQGGLLAYLDKVEKYDKEKIEEINNKYMIEDLEKYIQRVEQTLRMTSREIQAAEKKKVSLQNSINAAKELKNKIKKEDDNDGTAEQL